MRGALAESTKERLRCWGRKFDRLASHEPTGGRESAAGSSVPHKSSRWSEIVNPVAFDPDSFSTEYTDVRMTLSLGVARHLVFSNLAGI